MTSYPGTNVPTFTFHNYKVYVNASCIKSLPDFDYVQIMVNPTEKKLTLHPCSEYEKNALRWCSATAKRSPRKIACRIFFAKVMALMNWNPGNRYKLFGNLIRSNKDTIFTFDLTIPEVCENPDNPDNRSIQAAASNGYTIFCLQTELKNEIKEV